MVRPVAKRREQWQLLWRVLRTLLSRATFSLLAGAALGSCVQQAMVRWFTQRRKAEILWRQHADFSEVQACLLSTEHLEDLGRVEKRTLFIRPISEVILDGQVLSRLLETARKELVQKEEVCMHPMILPQLSGGDKRYILNMCTNHLSSCFAPYHVFLNEARHANSHYQSSRYCFTVTCAQTAVSGRWFITPFRPALGDVGTLRIRIVLMNEQELSKIVDGAIRPPGLGFFNGRHESRWQVCRRFAELLRHQTGRAAAVPGAELAGRQPSETLAIPQNDEAQSPEDNAVLRLHIPFPSRQHHQPAVPNKLCNYKETERLPDYRDVIKKRRRTSQGVSFEDFRHPSDMPRGP